MEPQPRSLQYLDTPPKVDDSVFVARNAIILGDVTIGEESSVWYGCTLRGDINRIVIGAHTNIQDGVIVHVADKFGTQVGDWVTVGHRAMLHACTVEDEVLVGMGSIIMDGVTVGARSIVGAGALVTPGTVIPPGSMVLGSPARVTRSLTEEEQAGIKTMAMRYVYTSREYLKRKKN